MLCCCVSAPALFALTLCPSLPLHSCARRVKCGVVKVGGGVGGDRITLQHPALAPSSSHDARITLWLKGLRSERRKEHR